MLNTRFVIRAFGLLSLLLLLFIWSPVGFTQDGEGASTSPFAGLRFREIGPATPSGRIDDFAVLESNPAVFYVATATGGLWKTVNQGTTFTTVFDNESTSSIGDVAIALADANVVWVCTGENNIRQSSLWGDGIDKSVDGGKNGGRALCSSSINRTLKLARHQKR